MVIRRVRRRRQRSVHDRSCGASFRYVISISPDLCCLQVSCRHGDPLLRKLLKVQELPVVLGNRIRELRRKKGFSQESFADHCGLHRTYMGGIERGEHNLTIQTALTIARGLGISLSKLFSGIEDELDPLASRQ